MICSKPLAQVSSFVFEASRTLPGTSLQGLGNAGEREDGWAGVSGAHPDSPGLLTLLPSRFLIGGQATGWCSQGCQAIVDTGTSLLTVPQQYMSALQQATGAQQNQYGQVCGP